VFVANNLGLNASLGPLVAAFRSANEAGVASNLRTAEFVRNSLTDRDIDAIVDLLNTAPLLHRLSLCWNGFGDEGCQRLAIELRKPEVGVALLQTFSNNCNNPNCLDQIGSALRWIDLTSNKQAGTLSKAELIKTETLLAAAGTDRGFRIRLDPIPSASSPARRNMLEARAACLR
jgi:hypothetical protein